jgi:hypothetical protein
MSVSQLGRYCIVAEIGPMIGRLQADQSLEPALLFITRALSEHTLGKLMTLVLCYFVRNCLRRCLWSDGYFDYLNSVRSR